MNHNTADLLLTLVALSHCLFQIDELHIERCHLGTLQPTDGSFTVIIKHTSSLCGVRICFYSDGSACLPRSPCHITVIQLARPFEQTCPLKTLALCQYLQGVSCLCPARHVLGLQQQLMFHSWSGAGHRFVCLCDGLSGSDVIRHVLTLDSTSVWRIVSPQYLLLGLVVDLSASLPWMHLKGSLAREV